MAPAFFDNGETSLRVRERSGSIPVPEQATEPTRLAKRLRGVPLGLMLAALGLLALAGCKPPKVSPIIFRVMTYNIHHAQGLDGKVDLDRVAKVITDANADAVALQELDQNTRK